MAESKEYYRFILSFEDKKNEIVLDGERAKVLAKFLGLQWPATYARRENVFYTLLLKKPMGNE